MKDSLKYNIGGIITIALLVLTYTATDNLVKIICGFLLFCLLIISMVLIHRSLEITSSQKWIAWIFIPIIIIKVTVDIYYLWKDF